MAYATTDDITKRYGAIDQNTSVFDDNQSQTIETMVKTALDDATIEIDMYIKPCFALPLAEPLPILVSVCVDIAVYNLSDNKARQTEIILTRYQNAIKKLTRICPKSKTEQLQATADSGKQTVLLDSSPRRFNRDTMGAIT